MLKGDGFVIKKSALARLSLLMCFAVSAFLFSACGPKGGAESSHSKRTSGYSESATTSNNLSSQSGQSSGTGSLVDSSSTGGGILVPRTSSKSTTSKAVSTTSPNNQSNIDKFISSVPKNLSGKTVKILVWYTPSESETKKLEYFTAKTGIKIKFIQTPLKNYPQKLSALISQGNPPDLAKIMDNDYPSFIMMNYFQPLSAGALNLSDKAYDLQLMNQYKWKGQHYGATVKGSSKTNFWVIVFNKTMFARKGVTNPYTLWKQGKWNWDTLLSAAKAMTDASTGTYGLTSEYHGNYLVQSAGVDPVIITEDKIINNTAAPKLLKAWQFLNDLEDKHKVFSLTLNLSGFCSGKAAMYLAGNYVMQKGDQLETNMKDEWGFAPCPSPAGQSFTVSTNTMLWGFPTGSKNAEAASYAMRFWIDPNFDLKGYETWYNNDVAEFTDWLWSQPKTPTRWEGIVNYGGNYSWHDMSVQLINTNAGGVKSVLESWSSVIDANIAQIMKEFG